MPLPPLASIALAIVVAVGGGACGGALKEPDGAAIPRDPSAQNGWDYTDATQTMIRIYGPSCDAVTRAGGVTIVYLILLP